MTRTALVRVAVANPEELLRRGMFATVDIDVGPSEPALLVPREAIIDSGESQIAFVSLGKGRFEPRRVAMGRAGEQGTVQVLAGLKAGEVVVVSGQFLLDSESRLREAIAKFLGQSTAGAGAPASQPTRSPAAPDPAPAAPDPAPATVDPAPAAAQRHVDETVRAYLVLAEALGAAQEDETPLDPDELIDALHALEGEVEGLNAHRLVMEAASAAETLKDQPLDRQRELFKNLSVTIIAVVDARPPSPAMTSSLYVVNCPMAEADWLQRAETIRNPYYADAMKECGSVVRPVVGAKGAR